MFVTFHHSFWTMKNGTKEVTEFRGFPLPWIR